jgi:hypothetical protein
MRFFGEGFPHDSLIEVTALSFLNLLHFPFEQLPSAHYYLPDAAILPLFAVSLMKFRF